MQFDNSKAMLRALVNVLGGQKVVSMRLWPEKGLRTAEKYLSSCLNQNKREHLHADDIFKLLKWAGKLGYHVGMDYICDVTEYGRTLPVPIQGKPKKQDKRKNREVLVKIQQLIAQLEEE